MNTGQRPLSVGEEETHRNPSTVTRDDNLYKLLYPFSYLHTGVHFTSMLFTVYDIILSRLKPTYRTLRVYHNIFQSRGHAIFDVLRLTLSLSCLASMAVKGLIWDTPILN